LEPTCRKKQDEVRKVIEGKLKVRERNENKKEEVLTYTEKSLDHDQSRKRHVLIVKNIRYGRAIRRGEDRGGRSGLKDREGKAENI